MEFFNTMFETWNNEPYRSIIIYDIIIIGIDIVIYKIDKWKRNIEKIR